MSYRCSITTKIKYQKAATLKVLIASCITCLCISTTTLAYAIDYTFTWSANPEPVTGYRLYYKEGGSATPPIDWTATINVGKVTTYEITGLEDNATYHFTLTALNGTEESKYADIITVPQPDQDTPAPIITNIKTVD